MRDGERELAVRVPSAADLGAVYLVCLCDFVMVSDAVSATSDYCDYRVILIKTDF